MSNKYTESESPVVFFKNESSRQRWELFHEAIRHAKNSNAAATVDAENPTSEPAASGPLLSIVR